MYSQTLAAFTGKSLVFNDFRVANAVERLKGVTPKTEVSFFKALQSGVRQITEAIAQPAKFFNVNLVSHGQAGICN